jgi:hypothetical protein
MNAGGLDRIQQRAAEGPGPTNRSEAASTMEAVASRRAGGSVPRPSGTGTSVRPMPLCLLASRAKNRPHWFQHAPHLAQQTPRSARRHCAKCRTCAGP